MSLNWNDRLDALIKKLDVNEGKSEEVREDKRTSEEIKKGLENCADVNGKCSGCPYAQACDEHFANGGDNLPADLILVDAFALIRQLERERDAAIKDMYHAASDGGSFCDICKYKGKPCDERKFAVMECWEWRGPQEENKTE